MVVNGVSMFFAINSKLCSKANISYSIAGDSNFMNISCNGCDCEFNNILYDCENWGIGVESQELLIGKINKYLCCNCSKNI